MGEPTRDIRRFGRHLRSIREARKLSLDAVEELASGYPEQVTKSHLSRIENGQAEPSFRRMYTLGRIYGVSVTSLFTRSLPVTSPILCSCVDSNTSLCTQIL